jgi:MbtH protein
MHTNTTIDGNHFMVLVNSEGQYSIWPSGKPIPDGWTEAQFAGSKTECTSYIDQNWLDMRPASLSGKQH